jgi:hypothetical protein
MKHPLSALFIILILAMQQQPLRFEPLSEIKVNAKIMETDRLGNVYLVSLTNQLYKYNSEGKLLSTLNYKYIGNITHVDASNPMEIYVFYQELNKIIYLDNNLAYRGETDLANLGVGQASAIGRAFDNGIWVFDVADMQLKKMDKKGENMQTSGNVKQYTDQSLQPVYIFDNNDKVYVDDPNAGVMVFDVFATYIKTIPIRGTKKLKIIDEDLYYHNQSTLYRYNFKSLQTFNFSLPDTINIQDVSIEKARLYIRNSEKVKIYVHKN